MIRAISMFLMLSALAVVNIDAAGRASRCGGPPPPVVTPPPPAPPPPAPPAPPVQNNAPLSSPVYTGILLSLYALWLLKRKK